MTSPTISRRAIPSRAARLHKERSGTPFRGPRFESPDRANRLPLTFT
jgi:hypothetical protein